VSTVQLQRETVLSLLADHAWFTSLSERDLQALVDNAETVVWERGETVFEEGERGHECYVLHTGAVRIVRRFADGRRIHLARFGPGDVVGELALFDGERRSATVEAVEPTVAVVLDGDHVMAILRNDPEAALSVVIDLAERLRASNERLFEHALATVTGRVAATLLGQVEARQAQGAGDRDIELVGSPVDVARLAGAPRESAVRALHWFENEGTITLRRGKTIVHDPAALSRYLS
jgi:CRP/FNR family transcriptional regulator, cyclic AMP receptor protein